MTERRGVEAPQALPRAGCTAAAASIRLVPTPYILIQLYDNAEDRCTWDVIVRQFCDIEKAPTPKDERLLEHVAGRPYAVTFRDSEQRQN